jgi:cholesterol transport system auxiliary component
MKRAAWSCFAALALAACSLTPVAPPRAVYDLGPGPTMPAAQQAGGPLAWRIADVTAPPWLNGDGIAYRLAFQQAQRLEHYRDSFWAAPPAALLGQRLRERLAGVPACAGRPAALLAVSLDEFEQVFSAPASSHVVLRLQATLWPAGSTGVAVHKPWRVERPAASPDAAGAVQALAQTVDEVLPLLADWLATQAPPCR